MRTIALSRYCGINPLIRSNPDRWFTSKMSALRLVARSALAHADREDHSARDDKIDVKYQQRRVRQKLPTSVLFVRRLQRGAQATSNLRQAEDKSIFSGLIWGLLPQLSVVPLLHTFPGYNSLTTIFEYSGKIATLLITSQVEIGESRVCVSESDIDVFMNRCKI